MHGVLFRAMHRTTDTIKSAFLKKKDILILCLWNDMEMGTKTVPVLKSKVT